MKTSLDYHKKDYSRSNNCLEEEEIEEEQKMEKFYELIRRFREARDYQRSVLQARDQEDHHRDRDRDRDHRHDKPSWVPSFKWEDFRDVKDHRVVVAAPDHPPPTPATPGVRCSNKKRKIVDEEEREFKNPSGLDLNLSL